jgi:enoyl-CoA hydratase/carnithine racemase
VGGSNRRDPLREGIPSLTRHRRDTASSSQQTQEVAMRQRSVAAPFILSTQPVQGVLQLTLNRPQTRNSLSRDMLAALADSIANVSADTAIKAVVLAADGPAFCAGHDLKELTARRAEPDSGLAFFDATMAACSAMMQAITSSPKPFIAAVEGIASAAGCQLVATCDLAVASDDAVFATPGVNIGLFCSTPMVAVSRSIATKHAMEMLLLGESVDAATALRFGLINRTVPADQVRQTAVRLASVIASKSAASIVTGKRAFYQQRDLGLNAAYDHCSRVMVENLLTRDAEEGICAFIEKRPAVWER